jgi:hypothetical protein
MTLTEISGEVFDRITNPSLSNKEKAEYMRQTLHAILFVAERYERTAEQVWNAIKKKEDEEPPMFEEDDPDTSEESKLFWAFVDEMEVNHI